MKKIMLIAGLLFCSQTIFAQLEKGMKSIGLSTSFNYTKSTNDVGNYGNNQLTNTQKNLSYGISPTFSYFLSSKFAVGLSVGYNGSYRTQENQYYASSSNSISTTHYKYPGNGVSVSPFVKYYMPISDQLFFFVKGSIGGTYSRSKTTGYFENTYLDVNGNPTYTTKTGDLATTTRDIFSFNAGISPGILFMPSKKIGLEFSLGNAISYTHTQDKGSSSSKNTSDGFQFLNFNSMNVGTAIYYFF